MMALATSEAVKLFLMIKINYSAIMQCNKEQLNQYVRLFNCQLCHTGLTAMSVMTLNLKLISRKDYLALMLAW
jgi:1-deoxy-D-xylulose 5-phosphate reductoisomerase